MSNRLVLELDICRDCGECKAVCSYTYHAGNDGVAWLRELATYELTCRRCAERSCVNACPRDALEEQEDGRLRRYNLRCIGCQSCSHACPFGNLVPAAFLFRDTMCDFCQGRNVDVPECVRTCPEHAITYEDVAGPTDDLHLVGDHLAVRCRAWVKQEPVEEKKR